MKDRELFIHDLKSTAQAIEQFILDERNKQKLSEIMEGLQKNYNLKDTYAIWKTFYSFFRYRMGNVNSLTETVTRDNDQYELLAKFAEFLHEDDGKWLSTSANTTLLKSLIQHLPNYKSEDEPFFTDGEGGVLFELNALFQKQVVATLDAREKSKQLQEEKATIDKWITQTKLIKEIYSLLAVVLKYLQSDVPKNFSREARNYLKNRLTELLPKYKQDFESYLSSEKLLANHKLINELKFVIADHAREEEKKLQRDLEKEKQAAERQGSTENKNVVNIKRLQQNLVRSVSNFSQQKEVLSINVNEFAKKKKLIGNFFGKRDEQQRKGYRTFQERGIGKLKDSLPKENLKQIEKLFIKREADAFEKSGFKTFKTEGVGKLTDTKANKDFQSIENLFKKKNNDIRADDFKKSGFRTFKTEGVRKLINSSVEIKTISDFFENRKKNAPHIFHDYPNDAEMLKSPKKS